MVGARALSTIETPPVNRRPIRTEVVRNSPEVVKRAVETELRRGGQIFYLHNRVKTIGSVARKLQARFPDIRIAIGHGQMEENELEKVMTEFVAGSHDVLVCTTIIESGLDIPNCNTIIIEVTSSDSLSFTNCADGWDGSTAKPIPIFSSTQAILCPTWPAKDFRPFDKRTISVRDSALPFATWSFVVRETYSEANKVGTWWE